MEKKKDSHILKTPKKKAKSKNPAKSNAFLESQSHLAESRKSRHFLESRNNKKGKKGFMRIYNAFFYSISGISAAWRDEEAFRQIVMISCILIPLGIYLGETFETKIILIMPCIVAIIAELANSAIENAIDFTSLKSHPFAKKAKDMGSAMQLISCVFMAFVWIFYLVKIFIGF